MKLGRHCLINHPNVHHALARTWKNPALYGASSIFNSSSSSFSTSTIHLSSFQDSLSDWLNSKSSPNRKKGKRGSPNRRHQQPDELEQCNFQITRLNDVVAGTQATLLDTIQGPASGEFVREQYREIRTSRAWNDLLQKYISDLPMIRHDNTDKLGTTTPLCDAQNYPSQPHVTLLKALQTFEENELERKDKLHESMLTWRGQQLSKLIKEEDDLRQTSPQYSRAVKSKLSSSNDKKKKSKSSPWSSPFTNMYQWYQNRREASKPSSPQKLMGQQLQNEQELFYSLAKAGVDLHIVEQIVADASNTLNVRILPQEKQIVADEANALNVLPAKDHKIHKQKYIYVLDFKGDVQASKAQKLSDEISAILALPKDLYPTEVILRLHSPGGTVMGYGKCSAELQRLCQAEPQIQFTVCVDEIAASGGYLMASVAQTIYAAPFAAIGSIGVVASMPNVATRMKEEGLKMIQSTAGKYKRTVTPWKEPTDQELEKLQDDIDTIQKHFVSHVGSHRGDERLPDPTDVATGEVWYGKDALEKGLIDGIQTSEQYIQSKIVPSNNSHDHNYEVFHIQRKKNLLSGGVSVALPWWLSDGDGESSAGGVAGSFFKYPMMLQYHPQYSDSLAARDDENEDLAHSMLSKIIKKTTTVNNSMQNDVLSSIGDNDELKDMFESLPPSQRRSLMKAVLEAST